MSTEIPTTTGRLAGEVALVTGATGGLGSVVARMFASEGATVALTGRNRDRGDHLAAALRDRGTLSRFFRADLDSHQEVRRLIDAVDEEFGALTVLVTCHGAADTPTGVHDLEDDDWAATLQTDLTSVAWLCRSVIGPMLDADRGSIVLISSRAALRGTPRRAAYTAAKGAVNALARSIAVDYADHGIRCNSISAGHLQHETGDHDLDPERRVDLAPGYLTRLGRPEDVGYAALWLASRESEFVTGIDVPVDGGSTIARASRLG